MEAYRRDLLEAYKRDLLVCRLTGVVGLVSEV